MSSHPSYKEKIFIDQIEIETEFFGGFDLRDSKFCAQLLKDQRSRILSVLSMQVHMQMAHSDCTHLILGRELL